VEFDDPAGLPDVVDLLVAKKNRAYSARIAWRQHNKAGLALKAAEPEAPMPLDWILRLRTGRSKQRELRNRLAGFASRR
jgi:hypothetical protein